MTCFHDVTALYCASFRRKIYLLFVFLVFLAVVMIFAMAAGVYDLSSLKVLRALLGWETGPAHIVVWSVRLPRLVAALVEAKNLAQKVSQRDHVFIDKEQLLAWNPKIMFLDGTGFRLVAQEYQKDPKFFQGLKAFQQQQVYLLFPFNFYTTNIDTALADAYAVGKILSPEKFTDIDPKKRADEIYTFFVGQPVYDYMVKDFGQLGQVVRFTPGKQD